MRTVGVEEELLLVDAETGVPRGVAAQAIASADASGAPDEGALEHELQQQMIETDTAPTADMSALAEELRSWRRTAIGAARRAGVKVIASGASLLPVEPRVVPHSRYQRMVEHFGLTTSEALTCACHVHVSIDSHEEGVAVLDRIRAVTPLLIALSGNSPFWRGRDSGYASYRSQAMLRWPTAGPQDVFGTADAYDDLVQGMLRSGVMLDEGMVYFDARLSHRYPTVEIRVADVCADVRDSVLIAALCRAMVETAARDWRSGGPPAAPATSLIRLAAWQAGRYGLSENLLDPDMRPRPAREVVDAFLGWIEPALQASGDHETVVAGVERLFARGTGADRQRAVFEKTGQLSDVVAYLARVTAEQEE
ncbi:glutamate--cysteine ligase [Microbacterium horticulturae]|uniref:Putative glutamate--cysteine ligase 2 n=1 Tax=Microbacterium horticulturae TaxID=3028316 RepID=A0ABY8C682_9MICO|nr:glutamate--cysteine ligase [Microbacterium sp. KACC 23027]WEG10098.1 glutamate--cysteine ligase [Microbacterium sp. KACC 23027]